MNPWRESVPLTAPLYDARLAGSPRTGASARRSEEAERAAYERGRAEGMATIQGELDRQRNEFALLQNGILQSLRNSVAQVARECEGTLVSLALEVARKLVAGTPVAEGQVEASVREVLQEIEDKTAVRVQLHPEDLALLQQADSPLLRPTAGAEQITFETSDSVTRGGCMVQTSFGIIDGRRETKFEVLKDALLS